MQCPGAKARGKWRLYALAVGLVAAGNCQGNCKAGTAKNTAGAFFVQKRQVISKTSSEVPGDDAVEAELPLIDNSPGASGNGKPEMQECQGSCSVDDDCAGSLVCLTPKFEGWDGIVPGCRTTSAAKPLWGWHYCAQPPPEGWETQTTTTTTAAPTPAPPPAPSAVQNCPEGGVCARLMAFNVYYAALGRDDRMDGIAQAIADVTPDIAVITEQWKEKPDILDRIREKTSKYYEFCTGGPQEKWWDGDILYRADLYEVLEDGIMDWGTNRGLSWAVLVHRNTGKRLLVYGAHPVCCGNENVHLQNAVDFSVHAQGIVERYPDTAIVIMGDFNALEDWQSTQLYKGAAITYRGKQYRLDFKFRDSFRDTNAASVDAHTHNSNARLDYIFLERGDQRAQPISQGFRTIASWIWRSPPGESDHYPIMADVELLGS